MQRPNLSDPASVERLFIQSVERGDRKAIIFALDNAPDLNINCTDQDDRHALLIAIQNGNSGTILKRRVSSLYRMCCAKCRLSS